MSSRGAGAEAFVLAFRKRLTAPLSFRSSNYATPSRERVAGALAEAKVRVFQKHLREVTHVNCAIDQSIRHEARLAVTRTEQI